MPVWRRRPPLNGTACPGLHSGATASEPARAPAANAASGVAAFHLGGRGRTLGLDLPAVAGVLNAQGEEETVLIYQAEAGPDGKERFGGMDFQGIRVLLREDIQKLTPIAEVEKGFQSR